MLTTAFTRPSLEVVDREDFCQVDMLRFPKSGGRGCLRLRLQGRKRDAELRMCRCTILRSQESIETFCGECNLHVWPWGWVDFPDVADVADVARGETCEVENKLEESTFCNLLGCTVCKTLKENNA
jgi:hypothetical protein